MKRFSIIAVIAIVLIILYIYDPLSYSIMPKCGFKMITGYSCPGCGLQRAIHALLNGNPIKAIQYNYFLVYSGPYAFFLILEKWLLPECSIKRQICSIVEHRIAVYTYIVLFFIWFIIRNCFNL